MTPERKALAVARLEALRQFNETVADWAGVCKNGHRRTGTLRELRQPCPKCHGPESA